MPSLPFYDLRLRNAPPAFPARGRLVPDERPPECDIGPTVGRGPLTQARSSPGGRDVLDRTNEAIGTPAPPDRSLRMTGPTTAFIRRFRPEDALELLELFRAALHRPGGRHYARGSFPPGPRRRTTRTPGASSFRAESPSSRRPQSTYWDSVRWRPTPPGWAGCTCTRITTAAESDGPSTTRSRAQPARRALKRSSSRPAGWPGPPFRNRASGCAGNRRVFPRGVSLTNFRMDKDLSRPES